MFCQTNLFRTAAVNYLLEGGVQWGASPAVKVRSLSLFGLLQQKMLSTRNDCMILFVLQGVRDAAVDLLHTLVAVHAQVIFPMLFWEYCCLFNIGWNEGFN